MPVLALSRRTSFEFSVHEYLAGKRWPEAVGLGLVRGERDPCLSGWVHILPVQVMRYYLPSHLMLASLRLALANSPAAVRHCM